MIYSYGLKNYFGFKEGAVVSFELNNRVPSEISMGRDVATVLGVKGANGAGKTNLLKALVFMSNFCTQSFSNTEDKNITADPYFSSKKPSEFYIDFKVGDTKFYYELAVTREYVVSEKLYKKNIQAEDKKSRKVLVFERDKNQIVKRLEELSSIDVISLKKNSSLISTAYNYKFNTPLDILNSVYNFFSKFITNVYYTGLEDFKLDTTSIYRVSEFYQNNNVAFDFVKKIICESDLGISNIRILDRLDENGKTIYFPMFDHSIKDEVYPLTIWDQSSGTKSLYVKLYFYWLTLKIGGVLILDEFDLNCHPFMLPKLLGLFESDESNPFNAQFIFTSHITEVLEKLSKYRTYFVNKDENESYCYRLDEIGGDLLRYGRAITPVYNEGKIGGVPKL
ncbi:ATP/GTP-binding protein [Citrobacter freundii complex sp. 2024EL-00237]|uniref:AAA family ATPase n=1 Tax=Citrobacter freundii complex sp. 2024EL-00237 TaxID=3374253 RepID=UPI003753C422